MPRRYWLILILLFSSCSSTSSLSESLFELSIGQSSASIKDILLAQHGIQQTSTLPDFQEWRIDNGQLHIVSQANRIVALVFKPDQAYRLGDLLSRFGPPQGLKKLPRADQYDVRLNSRLSIRIHGQPNLYARVLSLQLTSETALSWSAWRGFQSH